MTAGDLSQTKSATMIAKDGFTIDGHGRHRRLPQEMATTESGA
jgi:hypothetical protein